MLGMKRKLTNVIGMEASGFHGNKAGTQIKTGSSSFGMQAGHHGKARFLPFTFYLLPCLLLGLALVTCDNMMQQDEAGTKTETVYVDWDPIAVITLKTTTNQNGTLSFMRATAQTSTAASFSFGAAETEYYTYRLYVGGELYSKGTVTVTNNGTTFNFISDSGNEFSATINDTDFSFDDDGDVPADSEFPLTFQPATIPAIDRAAIPANSISLDINELDFDLGAPEALTETLTATILPAEADTQVWWSSSKPDVARVVPNEDGVSATITALTEGTATIRVKTVYGGVSGSCVVTVIMPVTSGLFLKDGAAAEIDITDQLPEEGTLLAKAITWLNSTPSYGTAYPAGNDETTRDAAQYRIVLSEAEPATTGWTLSKNITVTLTAYPSNNTVAKQKIKCNNEGRCFW
jgi:hypothetical protein